MKEIEKVGYFPMFGFANKMKEKEREWGQKNNFTVLDFDEKDDRKQ